MIMIKIMAYDNADGDGESNSSRLVLYGRVEVEMVLCVGVEG